MKCNQGRELEVLRSPAGFYIGTFEEGPYCRCSCYYKTREQAQKALETMSFFRDCEENYFCSAGMGCIKSADQGFYDDLYELLKETHGN